MKKKQHPKQQQVNPNPTPTKELTDQDLNQVVGGLNPQPLPQAFRPPWGPGPGPDPHGDPTAVA